MTFAHHLKKQLQLHPSAEPRDAVKLCYQAAFGAEHLLLDIESARDYLDDEFSSVASGEGPLFEQISPDFCRVNLSAWKKEALPRGWLFEMFRITASNGAAANGTEIFAGCLSDVESHMASGEAPFTPAAWHDFMEGYDRHAPKPVHHSAFYRENEHPAYRVVSMRYARLIPLLKHINELSEVGIIAIDGRSAAGKTTLAEVLCEITGSGIIHMDDFFLPGDLRTEARLSEPGGNVHYERFLTEVLPLLSSGNAFSYQTFDCEEMQMGELRQVAESGLRVVEGAYSCHPKLGDYMGLRVFCDITPEEQLRRIRNRNGDEMADIFKSVWIPMEEAYLSAFSIAAKADIVC